MATSGGNRRLWEGVGIAVAGAMLAGSSAWWWSPTMGGTPPMRLMLVVVVTASAWWGGVAPGMLATAIGLAAIVAGYERPEVPGELTNRLARFGSLALLITSLFGGFHSQRRRADLREHQRDRAARELRRTVALLRSFYESSTMAMGVVELAGDDARIVSANAPTDRLFGRAPGEVEGRTAGELGMPPGRVAEWLDRFRGCLETGRPVRFEETGSWPGAPGWIAGTFAAMNTSGPDSGGGGLCSFFLEDITERKQTEAEVHVAKEQAEAASRAKDRFLAVLSHELRTPLTPALIGVASLIEAGPDPASLPALEMIRRNIELESRLIDDLLDLSRIARGRLRLDLEVVDLHRALRRAVEICRDEAAVAGLEVVLELEASASHVRADHARLMQIAWNLIRNAAKFTPAGGRLTIRTSNADAAGDVGRVVAEFADTGIGIAPEVLPRIFEAFEQGRDEHHVRSQGLGLGLAICRSLAEAMGGRLTASSAGAGHGSTFRLEFRTVPTPVPAAPTPPLMPVTSASPRGDRVGAPTAPGMRILLVEDNPDTLRYLATVLRRRGHEVVTADALAAAREAIRRADRPFDLLLSDIELPDGTGLELMRELSGRGGPRGIAMSGFGTEEDMQLSRAAGFREHLTKPIEPHRLDAALRRAGDPGAADEDDERTPTRAPESGAFPVFSMQEPLPAGTPSVEDHSDPGRGLS